MTNSQKKSKREVHNPKAEKPKLPISILPSRFGEPKR